MKVADLIAVVVGSGIGGGLRFALGVLITTRWQTPFPWHTFAINVVGSFLLGLLMALGADRAAVSAELRLFLGVGVLGGFTTFSTLSYESVALMQNGQVASGLSNMFFSAVAGMLAAFAGILAGRAV